MSVRARHFDRHILKSYFFLYLSIFILLLLRMTVNSFPLLMPFQEDNRIQLDVQIGDRKVKSWTIRQFLQMINSMHDMFFQNPDFLPHILS